MSQNPKWSPQNPHPLSQMKTELVWEGKYDEFGNRREVDIAGCAMPMQKIETIDQPRSEAAAKGQLALFEKTSKRLDDFRNMLIWGDNKCLRIDYLAGGGRLAFYTPDFFIRTTSGNYYLVETKGREDVDIPRKARAAIEWCKSASGGHHTWEYLYVPEGIFERHRRDTIEELARSCAPALQNLIRTEETEQKLPLIAMIEKGEEEATAPTEFVDEKLLQMLPSRYQDAVKQSIMLFKFFENKRV